MTGTVVTHKTQVGQSGTAANNFTIRTLDDGSLRVSRGNAGTEIADVLVIDASGNFSTAPVLGVGQTWQNVTGSRLAATTYTNSTGRSILVAITPFQVNLGTSKLTVGGIDVGQQAVSIGGGNNANLNTQLVAVVPAGATYVYTVVSGTVTIANWVELR